MACHPTSSCSSWTFTTLISAFLDLSIAFLLLCASSLTFFTSKFLSFFGFHLPCPCTGLFSHSDNPKCLQNVLVDLPTSKIASVHLSVKNNFPFDAIFMQNPNQPRLKLGDERSDEFLEGGDSSSLVSEKNGVVDFGSGKGKGILGQRFRSGPVRRRRRVKRVFNPQLEDNLARLNGREDAFLHHKEAQDVNDLSDGTPHSIQLNDILGESKNVENYASSSSEVGRDARGRVGLDQSEAGTIRVLEQALEEEYAARAALNRELEKERSAAASAADEAMAMILRLQEEKAAIEMESRQYHRMIEEKSAYDAEEMNILKEILLRREREKHFLEKEVEAYRLVMSTGDEQLEGSFDSTEDPVLMLQQISESINKKEIVKNVNHSDYNVLPVEKHGCILVFEKESSSLGCDEGDDILKKHFPHEHGCMDEYRQDFQEKEMVSIKQNSFAAHSQGATLEADSGFSRLNQSQEHNSLDKIVTFEQGKVETTDHAISETITNFPCDSAYLEKHGKDADRDGRDQHRSNSEAKLIVLDVHVIDDKPKSFNQGIMEETGSILSDRHSESVVQSEASAFSMGGGSSGRPSTSREDEIIRSKSDTSSGSDKLQGKLLLSDLRRNSISLVDNERVKLENEVEWLRERLKIVQEGREKLSFSVEHREREKFHLQLLEDIGRQLQEIRQLTEPGKAVRQASLPPSSSKVSSKKRRHRSVSCGVHGSS